MPYTLLKFLLWFGLAALVGGTIGWLLRSVKSRGEIATMRPTGADDEEIARLRQRLTNMDEVVAERDRLRIKVAELRTVESADADLEQAGTLAADADVADTDTDHESGTEIEDVGIEAAVEIEGDDSGPLGDGDARDIGSDLAGPDATPEPAPGSELDLDAAAAVLGRPIALDDLTVVEGIGPKISELCRGINIDTWRDLAGTSLDELRSMLDDAGPRYQVHKPDSWPVQAELLATGQWEAFKSFTDTLATGR